MNREPQLLKFYEHKSLGFLQHNADVSNVSFLIFFLLQTKKNKEQFQLLIKKNKSKITKYMSIYGKPGKIGYKEKLLKDVICKQDDERGLVITSSNATNNTATNDIN